MAQNIEIPVSLGLKDAQAQINQLRQSLQQSVKLDSTAGKGLIQILNNAQKMVDNLTGKMSTSFKSASSSSSFLKDYEKMIGLLTTVTEKMTNLGVTDIKFSVADQQMVDSTIQKIQSLQASLESIQSGKAIEVINMSQVDGIDNLRQKLTELKLDASKLTFDEIGTKLGEAASKADANVQKLTNDIANINSQMNKLNTQGFTDISKLSDFSTKGVARILDAGNVDSVNNKLQKLASTMAEITVKPMTVTAGQNIDSVIESQTRAIEKKYNEQIQVIQQNKEKITAAITQVTEAGMRTAANGKTSSGHWTNEQMQTLMSMPSVENIINRLKADTTLNFDNLGIRQQFARFREALNEELNSLNTKGVNLQGLRDNVKNQVTEVFEGAGEAIVGNRSQLQSSIKSIFSNLGINGDELKKIFDINSISSGDKMVDVIDRIKQGLTSYIDTLDKTANTDLSAKLKDAQASFDGLTQAQNTNKSVSQESGNAAQSLQDQINTLAQQIQDLINKYNQLTGQNINFDTGNIEGAKSHIESYIQSLNKLQSKQKALSNIQMAVNRWMGFWQVLNMTKSAINDMKQHIQELDTVMTSISVVTNFSQEDLWGQISQYSEIARQYGVAIKGVYEVSQIYYQQGLQQNDVMTLTTETLKMARIAGLDYATAADYMTTAIRGFKLEMQDAAHVTDVFSALAATTASSTEEIAVAISKTASSAEAVGASFEATSAMMATMIATTRESATNIGTALKSVISRYGEMTSDPSKTVDSEGEEMSLNRVDKALQTVGITIHDTAGQFRDFDDVMLELMEKWDSLDSLSQRYIATLMAGNRQQSRFLALVSNVDEYKKALETATNAEGTGELQTLKTLDSIDAKIEKMKVTIQEFYTSSGLEELYKNVIDAITNIVSAGNSLPKFFDKIPGLAVALGFQIVATIKSVLSLIIAEIQLTLNRIKGDNNTFLTGLIQSWRQAGEQAGTQASTALSTKLKSVMASKAFVQFANIAGSIIQLVGSAKITQGMTQYGASTSVDQDREAARTTLGGTVTSMIGGAVSGAAMGAAGGVPGIVIGALGGIVTSLPSLVTALNMNNVNLARKIELDKKAEAKAKEDLAKDKGEEKSLQTALDQLNQLKAAQYDSAEAAKEYTDYMNQLGDQYPNLIDYMNQSGDAIISVTKLEAELARARGETAASTVTALKKEQERLNHEKESAEKLGSFNLYKYDDNTRSLYDEFGDLARKQDLKSKTFFSHENEAALVTAWMEAQGWNTGTKQQIKRYNEISTGQHRNERAVDFLQNNELRKQILNWSIEHYGAEVAGDNTLATLIRSKLKTYIEESKDDKILGWLGLESTDEISGNMTYSELFQLGKQIQTYSNNLVNTTQATLQNVADTLVSAEISKEVQTRLNEMANSNDQKQKDNSNKLQKYISLMSFIYSGMGDAIPDKNTMAEFEKWLLKDEERADKLLNLDYSKFRNITDIASYLGEEVDGDFFSTYGKALQTQLQAIRKEEIEGLEEQLQKSNLTGKFEDLYDNTGNNELISALIPTFRADVTKYQSLMDKGLYAQAEAYLHNMEQLYGPNGIGSLSSELQTEAFSVIKDLDLSDPEALHSAAETFAEMGPEFKGLSDQFTNAALRWATSAATLLEQLSSSTQETAKSIESSISDMSKVFKYSEALEKAQALMDANEGVEFKELFTYDKDLGGYVKTAKAFQLEMVEFEKTSYDAIQQSIIDNQTILPQIDSIDNAIKDQYLADIKNEAITGDRSRYAKQQFEQRLKAIQPEASDMDLDRLWSEYTAMIDAFEAQSEGEKEDWNTFTEEYLQKRGSDLAEQLKEIQQMPQEMAQQVLQSFDYTTVVSGKGTAQSKETLKALLMAAGGEHYASDVAQFFDEYYTKLITGNIKEYNKYLKHFGLSDFQVSEGQANRARFESLTSLYQKIASGDVVWDALTQQEQELLNSVEGVNLTEGANAAQVGAAADNVWIAIIKLIQAGAGTLNEVADTISSRANKAYGNTSKEKSYQLLDNYKDGLTAEELVALQGKNQGLLIDESTGRLSEEAAKYLTYDNGKFIAKAGQDAASVLTFLAQTLGYHIDTTTEEYKKSIEEATNEQIAKNEAENYDKNLRNVLKSIFSGSEDDQINVAGLSEVAKKRLTSAGYDISNNILTIGTEQAMNAAAATLEQQVDSGDWFWKHYSLSAKDVSAQMRQLQAAMAKNAAFEGIVGEQFNQSAAEALSMALQNTADFNAVQDLMHQMQFQWDEAAQVWKASSESIKAARMKIDAAYGAGQIDREEFLHLRAQLDATAKAINPKTKQDNALLEILQNYNAVTDEMLATFATEFRIPRISIKKLIKENDNGTYDVNVGELRSFLESISFEYDEAAKDQIATITDAYFNNIEMASKYVSEGTSSFADMQSFTNSFNELVKPEIAADFSDLFVYDTELNNFKLNSGSLSLYIKAQTEQLKELGFTDEVISEYIKDRTTAIQQENLDISSYLNADNAIDYQKSLKQLAQALRDMGFTDTSDFVKLDNGIKDIKDMSIDTIISILEQGGQEAVKLLIALKGESVTSEEITQVYNAQIDQLRTAQSELTKNVGDTVSGLAAGLIRATGKLNTFKEVGNGDIVITSAQALVEAQKELYKRMKDSNEATKSDINSMFADLLESNFKQANDIKDMLEQGGVGIDAHEFGEMLAAYDRDFETFFTNKLIQIDQFGKVLIPNFDYFATAMGWDYTSKEFQEYYNTYVDSIVAAQNKPLEGMQKTTEQIISILEAKAGEAINVSSIETVLGKNKYGQNLLRAIAQKYGATLTQGILTLGETTNVQQLVSEIASEAANAGAIIPEELAEITDAVVDMLSNIVSLLSTGLDGSLTNVQAEQLNSWYKNQQLTRNPGGKINSLEFTQTQDGLRIANNSARALYQTIKDIDATQGNITFNKLKESLISTEDQFKTIQDTTAYINELRGKIENPDNAQRLESLQEELELAEKINATRSIDAEDDSFKFMEGKIPEAQNNPLNYWNNWAKAFKVMRNAGKAGGKAKNTIGYQDFYNVVTEMGRLAELSGESVTLGKTTLENSQDAANLITQAAGALKNVDGEMKIDLSKLNIDFSSGLQDLGKQIDTQVDALASEQIHMLDAVISVLEIIVAMEDLKELDVNEDLTLDFEELGIKVDENDNNRITEVDGTLQGIVDKLLALKTTIDGETSILDALTISTGTAEVSMKDFLTNFNNVGWLAENGINGDMFKTFFSNMFKLVSDPTWQDQAGTVEDFFQKWAELDWGDLTLTAKSKDYTLKLGNEPRFQINWETANYKGLRDAYDQYKGKTDQEIREEVEKLINADQDKDGGVVAQAEINKQVKILQNKVIEIVDEKSEKPKWKVAGHSGEYDSLNAATSASNVYDTGAKEVEVTVDKETQTVTAKGKLVVGAVELDVESQNGANAEVKYEYDGHEYSGSNVNDIIDNIIKNKFKGQDGFFDKDETINRQSIDYKELALKLGFSITPILTYEINDQKAQGDLNTDASLRDKVNEFIKNRSEWKQDKNISIEEHTVKVKIAEGVEYTIPKGKLTINGNEEDLNQSLYNFLQSAMGIDLGLKDTISQAISESFTTISTTIKDLDAEPATNVANAIQLIGTNATTALAEVSNLVAELEKLNTSQSQPNSNNPDVPVSSEEDTAYTIKVDKVQIDVSGASASIAPGTRVKVTDDSKVDIENPIMGVPSSLDPLDMTYIPKDLGQQQVPTGMSMTITNPIKAKVTTIEPILEEAEIKTEGETIEIPVELNADNLINDAENVGANISDAVANGIRSGESNIQNAVGSIETHIRELNTMATDVFEKLKSLLRSIQGHVSITGDVTLETPFGTLSGTSGVAETNGKITLSVEGVEEVEAAKESIEKPVSFTVTAVDLASSIIAKIANNLSKLTSKTIEITTNYTTTGRPPKTDGMTELPKATGNIGLAKSKGTLMGELGPELVVSNGRYFVAGQNGAEMVDLADDAIVFNHLQTEQLLKHGMSSGRGHAVTSERNAVAFAQGNIDGGPAMASASAALNALKKLRAMWESLRGASVSDLAKGAGGGGGGGGGKIVDPKAWIDTVERWYNLMQEIARLEQQITHEEKLRAKLQSDFQKNGKAYYTSQKLSLDSLEQQIQAQEQLNLSREDYLDRRIAALKENSFGKIYQFDPETNQLEFRKDTNLNGFTNAMEFLTDLYGFNEQGKANYTNKQKYEILKANGFGEQMLYKDGMEIKADSDNSGDISDEEWESFYEQATEAFRDRMDEYAQATQSLRDEIQKGKDQLLELQTQVNEILQDMRDNQMDVENKVLDAIIDLREREIDALQDERDKLEESVNKYVDGLSNALDKEQKMYQNQESQNDLDKQRRRLAILQRSGGSASDIASLQNDINQSERDMYFDLQQQQIDAIQEASQLELERMDTQIEIMNETLEFQKEYGLLWEEVYNVMGGSAAQITDFISGNSEFWSKSPLATSEEVNKIFFGAEQWTSYRDNIEDWNKVRDALFNQIKAADKQLYDTSMRQEFGNNYDPTGKYAQIFEESYNKYGDVTKASTAARSAYTADKLATEEAERKRKEEDAKKAQQTTTAAAVAQTSSGNNEPVVTKFTGWEKDANFHWRYAIYSDGSKNKINYNAHQPLSKKTANGTEVSCSVCGKFLYRTVDNDRQLIPGNRYKKASGGYVDHGVYELGERGTETVLTASQTKVLRDNILSNRPSSLISLLKTYNEGFSQNHLDSYSKDTQALYNSISNNDGINIENATVNMNVQQLANDYDAKRAGEQALAEIMRIARKTSANNSIRR